MDQVTLATLRPDSWSQPRMSTTFPTFPSPPVEESGEHGGTHANESTGDLVLKLWDSKCDHNGNDTTATSYKPYTVATTSNSHSYKHAQGVYNDLYSNNAINNLNNFPGNRVTNIASGFRNKESNSIGNMKKHKGGKWQAECVCVCPLPLFSSHPVG